MNIEVSIADYLNPRHAKDLITLLGDYAEGSMDDGKALFSEKAIKG